jgi:hypothetical protein
MLPYFTYNAFEVFFFDSCTTMPGSLAREFSYMLEEQLDIWEVVCAAHNLLHLCRPLIAAVSALKTLYEYVYYYFFVVLF